MESEREKLTYIYIFTLHITTLLLQHYTLSLSQYYWSILLAVLVGLVGVTMFLLMLYGFYRFLCELVDKVVVAARAKGRGRLK